MSQQRRVICSAVRFFKAVAKEWLNVHFQAHGGRRCQTTVGLVGSGCGRAERGNSGRLPVYVGLRATRTKAVDNFCFGMWFVSFVCCELPICGGKRRFLMGIGDT